MSSLSHHGIKGQRWGVRRFQNKDGTRTALGKKQLKAKRLSRNEKGIRDVYRSLSDEDFRTLGYSKEEADQERKDDFLELGRRHTDYDQYNRVRYKDGKAVGYIAATGYQTTVGRGKKIVNILAVDLAVHSEYRGNGYSVALGKDLVRWFDTYGSKEYDRMEWYAMSENIGSQKAAERSGFTRRSSKEAAKGWVKYRYDKKQQLKHTSMDASPYLSHHGIKGQKWGIRRTPEQLGRINGGTAKVYKLHNYKGPLYFISEQDLDGETLHPRVPQNYLTQNGFEDNTTERVCFSYDPGKCLTAMSSNVSGKTFNVYSPADKHDVYKPNNITVPDADVTGELWIKEPVKLKKVGSIKCTGDTGEDGLKYTYGDQEAELYDWNYEWLDRSDQTSATKLKHTSIGGTMYIEGNALILGDSSYLEHHGIKGQKWGVRRFQNADGTRTSAGKKRYSVEAVDVNYSRKEIKKLVKGFSRKDKEFFFGRRYWDDDYDKGTSEEEAYFGVKKRFVIKEGKDIVAFIDAQQTSEWNSELNMVIGTKASARGKGYASALAEKMVDWYDSEGYKSHEGLRWQAANENTGSRKIAEKTGFKQIDDDGLFDDEAVYAYSKNGKQELDKLAKEYANKKSVGKEVKDKINSDFKTTRISKLNPTTEIEPYGWVRSNKGESEWSRMKANLVDAYAERWVKKKHSDDLSRYDKASSSYGKAMSNYYKKRKVKHTSIGGTMYIEGNALILGDSSYLEHHGIKGQRWGVRRFQNRDGSLTNAGRKRLGYATKSAVQTVSKAFKAGVKVGGNAVKAAKAHHEEAEAKKKEKKKEKASRSRLGVLANKDLFTDDELRTLNQRFKVEDELKMASIQKGVEIAKAVGTIASNAATAAKAYEDITGQSLSPIKRKAAELKEQQDAEDRARKIAKEDAEEARKAAQEERDIKKFDQDLRKATAEADKSEFLAKKTKAQADQEILKALKGARDFDKPDDDDDDPPKPPNGGGGDGNPPGGGSDDGSSWVQRATAGGKNIFEQMKYDSDPEYRAAKDAHDEKVAQKERMAELDRREKERQAEKAAKDQALMDMINQSNARTGRGQSTPPKQAQPETPELTKTPRQDSDALFSQKGSLPIDKDRYRNRHAAEKAKKVKEDVAEDRAKKQDEKAVDKTIDDVIEAQRRNTERTRNMDPHAYDRAVAKEYVKEKAKETIDKIPETLGNLNPINRAAKKIANKVEQEGYENTRKALKKQYEDMAESQGRDEANYVMYNTRIAGLQGQGYSEKQARQIADSDPTFSAKRNRRSEHAQKVSELETARRNTVKKLDQAEKSAVDDYYKKIYLDAYAPGTPKREALDREYKSTMDKIGKLREENQQLYEKGIKDAKKILEHSFSIQNGVLFIDESVSLSHHGIKGQRWGVRRFQNPDGTLTAAGKKRDARQITKELNKNDKALAWEYRHIGDRTEDYERWDKKAKKAEDKGKLDKAEKFKQKRDENSAKLEEHRKNAKSMNEKTVSLISEAVKKGYDVKTKDTRRSVNTGGEIAANIALNVLAAAAGSPVLVTRRKYIEGTKYKVKAKHDAFTIQNGTLFINAGEPYLEHHGVKGMKWGKHLMAGKGEAGAGGGSGEDDEKLKEMAKKAGISVAELRTKMASKIGGAASKVSVKDRHLVINGSKSGSRGLAVGETGEKPKSFKEKAYDALGGKYKTQASEAHREMVAARNNADDKARRANAQGRAANANKKAGNVREYMANKEGARQLDAEAKGARTSQWEATKKANRAQWKYDHSIAGLYDKATGKYKQAHKKTAIPKTIDRWKYEYKDGPNSKLFNNGKSKAKTAKEQAKAEVWNAADHQIKAKEYNDVSNSYGGNTNYYGQAYKNAAEREARLAEGSYRRAAALGKQTSSETSTSSRPRARKKKHTSGGSGVTVRQPGRKPVSRTKRVTQSSTGVKKRSRRVRHSDGSSELYTEGTRLVIYPKA